VSAPLNPRYTFPEFVVGKSNEAAYTAASAAAVAPGKLYNPILITGATGLGKTHLAHAVAAEAKLHTNRRATLLSADEFLRRLSVAMADGSFQSVVADLAATDMLIVDDTHVLDRHSAAHDALAMLTSQAVTSSTQVLLTSDTADGADVLSTRLVRRFRSAHIAALGTPDWAHRVAILHAKAKLLGVGLPSAVAHHLASQCTGSVRELEGSLTRMLAIAELDKTPLSLALAHRAVPPRSGREALTGAPLIQEAVAAEWGVAPAALVGAGRARTLSEPRRISMLLCRDLLSLSLREIGSAFGDRDVSTVLSAIEKARGDIATNPEIANRVARLRELLPAQQPKAMEASPR
jgi:chromosomal replication initiator protein